jgi:hypothetical protein
VIVLVCVVVYLVIAMITGRTPKRSTPAPRPQLERVRDEQLDITQAQRRSSR